MKRDSGLDEKFKIMLAEHFAPASLLLNDNHKIIHIFGAVNDYFREKSKNPILSKIQDIIKLELVDAVNALLNENCRGQKDISAILQLANDKHYRVKIHLKSCEFQGIEKGNLIISFHKVHLEHFGMNQSSLEEPYFEIERSSPSSDFFEIYKKLELKLAEMEEKSRVLSNLNRGVTDPLNSIRNFVKLLSEHYKKTDCCDGVESYLENIHESTLQLEDAIKKIFDS